MGPETQVPLTPPRARRRHLVATAVALLLGVACVGGAVVAGSALGPTGLLGLVLVVAGLVGVATLPGLYRRQTFHFSDEGLRWTGVGARPWARSWPEIAGATVYVARGRRWVGRGRPVPVALGLHDADAPPAEAQFALDGAPEVLADLRAAFARHAPGISLEVRDVGRRSG